MALTGTQLDKVKDAADKLWAILLTEPDLFGLEPIAKSLQSMIVEPECDEEMELLYRETAQRIHHRDGTCEIDDDAVVSVSGDHGAYVQAWVWVYDADTGKPCCDDCSCLLYVDEAAPSQWLCPECDKRYELLKDGEPVEFEPDEEDDDAVA